MNNFDPARLLRLSVNGLLIALYLVSHAHAQDGPITVEQFDEIMREVSNTGRWRSADQLGTLNLITPAVRQAAAQKVRDGVAVSMSLDVIRDEGPNTRVPLERRFSVVGGGGDAGWALEAFTIDYHGFSFSHIDGVGHAIYKGKLYNEVGRDQLTEQGAARMGVENMQQGIVTRGVLVDLPRQRGVDYLELGTFITPQDLEDWERTTGVTVREGDVLLIRTGRWAREDAKGEWRLTESAAGPHPSVARWLKARGVAVLAPLPVVGGVGSPLNPLAIF